MYDFHPSLETKSLDFLRTDCLAATRRTEKAVLVRYAPLCSGEAASAAQPVPFREFRRVDQRGGDTKLLVKTCQTHWFAAAFHSMSQNRETKPMIESI